VPSNARLGQSVPPIGGIQSNAGVSKVNRGLQRNEAWAMHALYSVATWSGVSRPVMRPRSRASSLARTFSARATFSSTFVRFQQLSRYSSSKGTNRGAGAEDLPCR
jgi:hypothetical protein